MVREKEPNTEYRKALYRKKAKPPEGQKTSDRRHEGEEGKKSVLTRKGGKRRSHARGKSGRKGTNSLAAARSQGQKENRARTHDNLGGKGHQILPESAEEAGDSD